MTNFLAMMTLYYMCDQAAAFRGLTPDEVTNCMANYERMKLEFIDERPAALGSAERAKQIRLGYRGFKAWEAANPELVLQMRQEARIALGLG
ncbi:hypothetical protein [Thalassococcus lentus]|uniref:Uncharacterized protein n=1 Tax=Thalassococcus lentus TaxID=1210524 RepID=A0ABT4XWM9_9RHOB|nr:hypothetical protein [Thalassococcus lentus]MDA7426356.1 hypothetical protein [Thalassococcus lentus]